jgi:hypothetical protein
VELSLNTPDEMDAKTRGDASRKLLKYSAINIASSSGHSGRSRHGAALRSHSATKDPLEKAKAGLRRAASRGICDAKPPIGNPRSGMMCKQLFADYNIMAEIDGLETIRGRRGYAAANTSDRPPHSGRDDV